jgi:hypothetical protein
MQLAVAPESFGQVLGCPHCHSQFQVAPPPAEGATSPGESAASWAASGSGATPRWRGDSGPIPSGFKLNDPAPATSPVKAAVPKFKPADPAASAAPLAQDGKLPELALAEVASRPKSIAAGEKKPRPLTMILILGVSLLSSVFLSLADFSPGDSDAEAQSQARARIARFYQESGAALEPYQLLLRDAQRARSRGDRETEREKYREVLRLLRAESRSTSLTDSRESDRELEAAIALALREQ